jgi:hypothetical protein
MPDNLLEYITFIYQVGIENKTRNWKKQVSSTAKPLAETQHLHRTFQA